MKAFWLFCKAELNGESGVDPHLPTRVAWRKSSHPGDIYVLGDNTAGQVHHHLLLGGFALQSDDLGDGHTHLVWSDEGVFKMRTKGAAEHKHTFDGLQSWFMIFVLAEDAEAANIDADPLCYPIVECPVIVDVEDQSISIGDEDKTDWTPTERVLWATRLMTVMDFELPDYITKPYHLVKLFRQVFTYRAMRDIRGYRGVS